MRLALIALTVLALPTPARALSSSQMVALLEQIDRRTTHSFDYMALVFLESRSKGKPATVLKAHLYRRDRHGALMILFVAPKSEAGSGYLRIKKNLWFYDPRIGKWERRTDRERIGGTSSNRKDFDRSTLARDYDPKFEGTVRLGKYRAHKLMLTRKRGARPTYPRMRIWVDSASKNILKRQEFAASGKLLRTSYFPKWLKMDYKGKEVWYPRQVRIFDEVVKGDVTTVVPKKVIPKPMPTNIFTKAWLESKSR